METRTRSRRAASSSPRAGASATASGPRWWLTIIGACVAAVLGAAGALLLEAQAAFGRTHDNIGGVASPEFLAYGPVDVVYTWVNGTDPRWKREKEFWHKHWIASLTGQPLPKWDDDTSKIKGKDDSNSDNRFRDNEELRYSLRSLEKYAPWVRHIYVVTDGQIPAWLDIESPRISIVAHRDIFQDKTHLPVFSSPAIEWSLDNIPGLSEWFLYFNDDVFLGSHVHPEDFVSQRGVQKVYFAWEAPLCSPNCWDTSLQNGRCDRECNVTACDFDMGDCGCDVNPLDGSVTCDADKIASINEQSPRAPKLADHLCLGRCHFSWLGNGHCDRACNVSGCGFDGGDCGVDALAELPMAELTVNQTLVHVPLAVNATVLNLTSAFGVNGSISSAGHDNSVLVRHATVLEQDMLLLLTFGRDPETGDPLTSSTAISVVGQDADGNERTIEVSVVRGRTQLETSATAAVAANWTASNASEAHRMLEVSQGWPSDGALSGGFATFQNTTIRPRNIRLPFGFRQAVFAERGVEDEDVVGEGDEFLALEVFLPFNLTGKKLKDGDELNLGWALQWRVHDDMSEDGTDFDWSDAQTCRLSMPKKETGPQKQRLEVDKRKPVEAAVDTTTTTETTTTETTGTVVEHKPDAEPLKKAGLKPGTFAFDMLEALGKQDDTSLAKELLEALEQEELRQQEHHDQSNSAAEIIEQPTPTEEHTSDDIEVPSCELVEVDGKRRGIRVTLRIPTLSQRAELSTTIHNDGTPIAADEGTASGETVEVGEASEGMVAHGPQIADGHVCFFDADREEPKRYCFALTAGHFHAHEQQVVHQPTLWGLLHPPRPVVKYTPYRGENEAFIELTRRCIDATERVAGMRPALCGLREVPISVPSDTIVDPAKVKEEEGRRLACAAQRQRLALKEQQGKGEEAAATSLFGGVLARIKASLGLSMVELTHEVMDDVEYADVCGDQPVEAPSEPISERNAQALLSKDTFGDSLRFVNKLYNRAFGKASSRRRVPSHMPFMFKKQYLREIKEHWAAETSSTSAHRFRHPEDMQFSFSYFHYLLNRHKVHPPTLEQIWRDYLDANRNGILDENEVLTVASLAFGDYPPDTFVTEVRECLQPAKTEKVREQPTAAGTVRLAETLTPYITFADLERCTDINEKLLRNVRREPLGELMSEDEVTFHMLSDNYKFAWNQMLGTRARRTKFVCINDDMKYPTPAVSQILHELFLSIWPKRSQFELPFHLKNRYAHIDEVAAARDRGLLAWRVTAGIALLLALLFRRHLLSFFGFHELARARAASASQLQQEMATEQDKDD